MEIATRLLRILLHVVIVAAGVAMLVVAVAFAVPLAVYGHVVSTAFEEGPGQNWRFDFVCKGFECEQISRSSPRVKDVTCLTRFFLGACCVATLDSELTAPVQTEVHVWLRGPGRYRLELTEPSAPTTLWGLDRR